MQQLKHLLSALLLMTTLCAHAQVGIGTATPEASAQLDVSSTTKGFLPPRMDSTQRNAIVSPAAGLTIYNTTLKSVQVYNGTVWYSTAHYIGESYGGGIVFFVYDNGQHGLIAATADQSTAIQWYNGTNRYTGTTGDGLGAGAMNTAMIVATQMADNQTSPRLVAHEPFAQFFIKFNVEIFKMNSPSAMLLCHERRRGLADLLNSKAYTNVVGKPPHIFCAAYTTTADGGLRNFKRYQHGLSSSLNLTMTYLK